MAATKALLIYSAVSKIPRRVIVPDEDEHIANVSAHLQLGEYGIRVPREHAVAGKHVELIASHHGISAADIPSGRCAVVHFTGRVVGVIMADPDIDSIPGMELVLSDTADIGDFWDGTAFQKAR